MQIAYQTRLPNSKVLLSISRVALDQKVEGSNPSSPATPLNCTPIRRLSDERTGQDVDPKMVRLEFLTRACHYRLS